MKNTGDSNAFLILAIAAIIIATIVIPLSFLAPNSESFSQVITVGPIWEGDTWICVSDSDFMLHGTLRGLENSTLEIFIENLGTQSLFELKPEEMETFSVGSTANNNIIITRTGTVTGFITLQTSAGAIASCTQQ